MVGGTAGTAGVTSRSAGMTGGTAGSTEAAACDPANVGDGFETYTPGGGFGVWKQNGVGGTLKVDTTHAFSGAQSIAVVRKPGGSQRVHLQRMGTPLFPATNNKFWGRVMAWAENLPGKSDMENRNVHYDLIQSSGTGAGEYRVAGTYV